MQPDKPVIVQPERLDKTTNVRTRTSIVWVTLTLFVVVLLLLTIFILQNSQHVKVSYFGWSGSLPLAVAMLFSAIAGALLLALAGGGRILQLRRASAAKQPAPPKS